MSRQKFDFITPPLTYSADMVFPYPWNKPLQNNYYKSDVEKSLTREQKIQAQGILQDVETLPRFLRYRYQKHYEKLILEQGSIKAHKFLCFTFYRDIWPRLVAVNSKYEMTVYAQLTAAVRFSPEISQFNRLFDLRDKPVKKLADVIAAGFYDLYEHYCDKLTQNNNNDREVIYTDKSQTLIYGLLAEISRSFHVTPLYYQAYSAILRNRDRCRGKQNLSVRQVIAAVQRLVNPDFWYRKLKAHRTQWLEALMIANMDVSQDRNPYASKNAIREVKAQRLSNMNYLQSMDIEDAETGERFDLFEKVMASISNPEIRRMELMAQMAGIEKVAMERGDIGMFITLTCPSKYHPTKLRQRSDKQFVAFNHNWKDEAFTPKDAQQYLVKVWSRIRSAFNDKNINVYGIRVVEPHHDATPHWHMLLFTDKRSRADAIDIMRKRALAEDGDERGAKERRFTCKHMNHGGAVGYIAKYIAKNIDGYALDGQIDDETGQPLTDMAAAVTAWASTWRIPQFQFYKLPSKGAYRECRRLRSISVAEQLGDVAERVRAGADAGDFYEYVMAQGGPCIKRKEETIRVARETIEEVNAYGEEVKKIVGIYNQLDAFAPVIKTRERQFRIVKKNSDLAGAELLQSAVGAPRSPVNNCRSRIAADSLGVQYFEPELTSVTMTNIIEYGFAGIRNDDESAAGEVLEQDKAERKLSRIELSDKEREIQSQIVPFVNEVGIDFDIPHFADMFTKGMAVSDGDYCVKFDGERLRLKLTKGGKELQKRELGAQKEAISQKYRQRCAYVLGQINKLREQGK